MFLWFWDILEFCPKTAQKNICYNFDFVAKTWKFHFSVTGTSTLALAHQHVVTAQKCAENMDAGCKLALSGFV